VSPHAATMIGDHRNDVLAARAAGTAVVFARYGYGLATLGPLRPDAMIDCFAELPAALQLLRK
jgi:phosphoglycolate phosphatase